MPRYTNFALKNRFKHGDRVCKETPLPSFANFMVIMTSVSGTGYIERFLRRYPGCTFAEYYFSTNSDGTFDIFAYLQLQAKRSVAAILRHFNCRTSVQPITVEEKLSSAFHRVPGKISFGVEKTTIGYNAPKNNPTVFKQVDTVVHIRAPAPTNSSCWLPQAPRPDPCLNRKRIYPINYQA